MNPLFFGPSNEQLFGVYHAPAEGRTRAAAIVLCPALGQEAIRAHRSFMQLGQRLSREGFPVLRFDFFGSGDSAGDERDWRLGRWVDDVDAAVREVAERGDAAAVCLVGLRLGASLALQAAARNPTVAGLVLWEPVLRGDEYLRELELQQREWLRGSFARARETDGAEAMGFRLTPEFSAELEAFDLTAVAARCGDRGDHVYLLGREAGAGTAELARALARFSRSVDRERVPGPAVWERKEDELDKGLIPRESLEAVERWLTRRFPAAASTRRLPPEDVV